MATKSGVYTPRNPGKYKGTYPIVYRSSWELKFMLYADGNPKVLRWSSESITIPYYNSQKHRMARYFPDFQMDYKDSFGKVTRYIVEIKPLHEAMVPVRKPRQRLKTRIYAESTYVQNQEKWEAALKFCEKNGLKFQVITERELYNLEGTFFRGK